MGTSQAEHTIRAYRHDLEDFAQYFSRALGISPRMDVNTTLSRLFRQSAPSAHEIVLGFRHWMMGAHLSSASINRHLACLRSVTKLGRMLGMMTWYLEVRWREGGETARDERPCRRGHSTDAGRHERRHRSRHARRGDRDDVLLLGLRVSELCGLNLQDTDLERGSTWILGKGRRERELVPLPHPLIEAIRRYLAHRGAQAGPLFLTRGQRGKNRDGRLETRSVLRIIRDAWPAGRLARLVSLATAHEHHPGGGTRTEGGLGPRQDPGAQPASDHRHAHDLRRPARSRTDSAQPR